MSLEELKPEIAGGVKPELENGISRAEKEPIEIKVFSIEPDQTNLVRPDSAELLVNLSPVGFNKPDQT